VLRLGELSAFDGLRLKPAGAVYGIPGEIEGDAEEDDRGDHSQQTAFDVA
jgi:hypothetical protein